MRIGKLMERQNLLRISIIAELVALGGGKEFLVNARRWGY